MALMVMFGMAFTSCKQDTQPRLQEPTEFVLNRPALADNLYVLTADNSIELTWSQPDYGMGVVANYEVQISYTEDFAEFATIEGIFTSCDSFVSGELFALAMCELSGYESEADFSNEPREVYIRVKSFIPGAEYATIYSNVIKLNAVQPYFAVKLPDNIWIVGACQGWSIGASEMMLTETAVESRIYTGTFYINAGEFQFRFYNQLGSWDAWSIGAQDADNPVDIAFTDGLYEGPCFVGGDGDAKGKGSWQVADWAGGNVKMTVDLNSKAVVFQVVD